MNSILLAFGALDPRLATECRALSLRQHEIAVRVGVHAHERLDAQRMWFDIDLCIPLDRSPATEDHISQTVDYDFIRETVAREVGDRHHDLQESLCDAIVNALLLRPEVQAVRVATCKPDIYPDSQAVGVERVSIKPW